MRNLVLAGAQKFGLIGCEAEEHNDHKMTTVRYETAGRCNDTFSVERVVERKI